MNAREPMGWCIRCPDGEINLDVGSRPYPTADKARQAGYRLIQSGLLDAAPGFSVLPVGGAAPTPASEEDADVARLRRLAESVRQAAKALPDKPISGEVVACAGIMGMANWLDDVAARLRATPSQGSEDFEYTTAEIMGRCGYFKAGECQRAWCVCKDLVRRSSVEGIAGEGSEDFRAGIQRGLEMGSAEKGSEGTERPEAHNESAVSANTSAGPEVSTPSPGSVDRASSQGDR